jgi:hypothetical protein
MVFFRPLLFGGWLLFFKALHTDRGGEVGIIHHVRHASAKTEGWDRDRSTATPTRPRRLEYSEFKYIQLELRDYY